MGTTSHCVHVSTRRLYLLDQRVSALDILCRWTIVSAGLNSLRSIRADVNFRLGHDKDYDGIDNSFQFIAECTIVCTTTSSKR